MRGGLEWARPATVTDLTRLRDLWDRAEHEMGEQRGGQRLLLGTTRPPELDATDPASETAGSGVGASGDPGSRAPADPPAVTDPGRILVVGGIDEVVLGFADAGLERSAPQPVAVLRAAYVEQGARGVGIGESMVRLVTEWAVGRGCVGLDAYALPGSRAAKAFLEDHGFVTRLLTMYRPLGTEGGEDHDH